MRRIWYIVLFIIIATAIAVPYAMLVNEPFKHFIINGVAGFHAGASNTIAGLFEGIQANTFYQAYIGPYIVLYGFATGILFTVIFQRYLWPRVRMPKMPQTTRPYQDAPQVSTPVSIPVQQTQPQPVATAPPPAPAPTPKQPKKEEKPKKEEAKE